MKCRRCRGAVLLDYGVPYCINCGDDQGNISPGQKITPIIEQVINPRKLLVHKPHGYWDEHRDELLFDRLDIGHNQALLKWGMPRASWHYHRERWLKQGIEITDLRGLNQIKKAKIKAFRG